VSGLPYGGEQRPARVVAPHLPQPPQCHRPACGTALLQLGRVRGQHWLGTGQLCLLGRARPDVGRESTARRPVLGDRHPTLLEGEDPRVHGNLPRPLEDPHVLFRFADLDPATDQLVGHRVDVPPDVDVPLEVDEAMVQRVHLGHPDRQRRELRLLGGEELAGARLQVSLAGPVHPIAPGEGFPVELREIAKRAAGEEVVLDENQTPEGLKDQGIAAIKTHHKEIAPLVEPQFVEEKRTVALGGENFAYDLTGVLDVVDTADTVIDNKLLGKTPNQADLDKDIQLSTYSLLYRLWQRKAESKLRLDIVVKNKLPKAVQLETQRSREGLRMHLNTMGHIAKAIEAEAFPMNPTGWWCSPKFCGYWSRCMGKGMVTVDLGQTLEAKLEQSLSKEG